MKNEIDATHYCARYADVHDCRKPALLSCLSAAGCDFCRHKWETPAQKKARTGEELPDNAAVYVSDGYNGE